MDRLQGFAASVGYRVFLLILGVVVALSRIGLGCLGSIAVMLARIGSEGLNETTADFGPRSRTTVFGDCGLYPV